MSGERRPVVGITLRPQAAGGGYRARLVQNRAYLERIVAAGAVPLCIPSLRDAAAALQLFASCDALVLPGGNDIEPSRYGAQRIAECKPGEPDLDEVDLLLCHAALEARRPLLAICRGQQLLNVACGGTLHQHIAGHDVDDEGIEVHAVSVAPGSLLSRIVGPAPGMVNSVHHQAIDRLGATLAAVAHAEDGVIEGVEMPGHAFVVGVQWHPEDLGPGHPGGQPLFDALVAAGGARVGAPAG